MSCGFDDNYHIDDKEACSGGTNHLTHNDLSCQQALRGIGYSAPIEFEGTRSSQSRQDT
jgi:hypothetical protein